MAVPPPLLGPAPYVTWRASELGKLTEATEDRLLFDLLGDVAGRRVLDVGCGDGGFALELHKKGAQAVAVDPDWEMIQAAKRRFLDGRADIALAAAAGERLPFADGSFDVVVAKTVLCFAEDAAAFVAEMARVLRPDGCLVIGELGKWSWWAAERRLRGWLGSPLWRRAHFWTPGELRRLASSAGLTVGQLRGAVYYPRVASVARLMAAWDPSFAGITTWGAAFLAMSASPRPDGCLWQ